MSTKEGEDDEEVDTRGEDLVTFQPVSLLYPKDSEFALCYTLGPLVMSHPQDWVGIFQNDSLDISNPLTFKLAPVQPTNAAKPQERFLTFPTKLMQPLAVQNKKYKFVYVSWNGQILGISPPFVVKDGIDDQDLEIYTESSITGVKSHVSQSTNQEVTLCFSVSTDLPSSDDDWEFATNNNLQEEDSTLSEMSDIVILSTSPSKEAVKIATEIGEKGERIEKIGQAIEKLICSVEDNKLLNKKMVFVQSKSLLKSSNLKSSMEATQPINKTRSNEGQRFNTMIQTQNDKDISKTVCRKPKKKTNEIVEKLTAFTKLLEGQSQKVITVIHSEDDGSPLRHNNATLKSNTNSCTSPEKCKRDHSKPRTVMTSTSSEQEPTKRRLKLQKMKPNKPNKFKLAEGLPHSLFQSHAKVCETAKHAQERKIMQESIKSNLKFDELGYHKVTRAKRKVDKKSKALSKNIKSTKALDEIGHEETVELWQKSRHGMSEDVSCLKNKKRPYSKQRFSLGRVESDDPDLTQSFSGNIATKNEGSKKCHNDCVKRRRKKSLKDGIKKKKKTSLKLHDEEQAIVNVYTPDVNETEDLEEGSNQEEDSEASSVKRNQLSTILSLEELVDQGAMCLPVSTDKPDINSQTIDTILDEQVVTNGDKKSNNDGTSSLKKSEDNGGATCSMDACLNLWQKDMTSFLKPSKMESRDTEMRKVFKRSQPSFKSKYKYKHICQKFSKRDDLRVLRALKRWLFPKKVQHYQQRSIKWGEGEDLLTKEEFKNVTIDTSITNKCCDGFPFSMITTQFQQPMITASTSLMSSMSVLSSEITKLTYSRLPSDNSHQDDARAMSVIDECSNLLSDVVKVVSVRPDQEKRRSYASVVKQQSNELYLQDITCQADNCYNFDVKMLSPGTTTYISPDLEQSPCLGVNSQEIPMVHDDVRSHLLTEWKTQRNDDHIDVKLDKDIENLRLKKVLKWTNEDAHELQDILQSSCLDLQFPETCFENVIVSQILTEQAEIVAMQADNLEPEPMQTDYVEHATSQTDQTEIVPMQIECERIVSDCTETGNVKLDMSVQRIDETWPRQPLFSAISWFLLPENQSEVRKGPNFDYTVDSLQRDHIHSALSTARVATNANLLPERSMLTTCRVVDMNRESLDSRTASDAGTIALMSEFSNTLTSSLEENKDLKHRVEHLENQLKDLSEHVTQQGRQLQDVVKENQLTLKPDVVPDQGKFKNVEHKRIPLVRSKSSKITLVRSNIETLGLKSKLRRSYTHMGNIENEIHSVKEAIQNAAAKPMKVHVQCHKLNVNINDHKIKLKTKTASGGSINVSLSQDEKVNYFRSSPTETESRNYESPHSTETVVMAPSCVHNKQATYEKTEITVERNKQHLSDTDHHVDQATSPFCIKHLSHTLANINPLVGVPHRTNLIKSRRRMNVLLSPESNVVNPRSLGCSILASSHCKDAPDICKLAESIVTHCDPRLSVKEVLSQKLAASGCSDQLNNNLLVPCHNRPLQFENPPSKIVLLPEKLQKHEDPKNIYALPSKKNSPDTKQYSHPRPATTSTEQSPLVYSKKIRQLSPPCVETKSQQYPEIPISSTTPDKSLHNLRTLIHRVDSPPRATISTGSSPKMGYRTQKQTFLEKTTSSTVSPSKQKGPLCPPRILNTLSRNINDSKTYKASKLRNKHYSPSRPLDSCKPSQEINSHGPGTGYCCKVQSSLSLLDNSMEKVKENFLFQKSHTFARAAFDERYQDAANCSTASDDSCMWLNQTEDIDTNKCIDQIFSRPNIREDCEWTPRFMSPLPGISFPSSVNDRNDSLNTRCQICSCLRHLIKNESQPERKPHMQEERENEPCHQHKYHHHNHDQLQHAQHPHTKHHHPFYQCFQPQIFIPQMEHPACTATQCNHWRRLEPDNTNPYCLQQASCGSHNTATWPNNYSFIEPTTCVHDDSEQFEHICLNRTPHVPKCKHKLPVMGFINESFAGVDMPNSALEVVKTQRGHSGIGCDFLVCTRQIEASKCCPQHGHI